MRDLLPEEAASRQALARAVLERFELFGYRVVTPPVFEFGEVLERGLGTLTPADVLRFVEPESGEVAVLRPDMTPQIARIVATRLAASPPPIRLAYEGTVVRRRAGRAKKHRQIPQVGVELCGAEGLAYDVELLRLAADVLRTVGLVHFTIDVSDAGIVRDLLADLPTDRAAAIAAALARKDVAEVTALSAGTPFESALVALARIGASGTDGRAAILADAERSLASTPAEGALRRLVALANEAHRRGLGDVVSVDPGEVRGASYYTGTIFSIYAEGPGEPLGGGGRYDDLLARFGTPMAAVGFGLDLDALAWALRAAGRTPATRPGVVVVGAPDDGRLDALRAQGIAAVAAPDLRTAMTNGSAWGRVAVWNTSTLVFLDGSVPVEVETRAVEGAREVARLLHERLLRGA